MLVIFSPAMMVGQDLELCCLASKTVSRSSNLFRAFLPLMSQVLKCSCTVLRPTAKVSEEKHEAWLPGSVLVNLSWRGQGEKGRLYLLVCIFFFSLPFAWSISYLLRSLTLLSNYRRQIFRQNYLRQQSLSLLSHHLQKTWIWFK